MVTGKYAAIDYAVGRPFTLNFGSTLDGRAIIHRLIDGQSFEDVGIPKN